VPLENDLDILPAVVRELDAVMRSHFGDYELIFIDDGSSDGTRSFFERAKSEIPCFRYSRLTRPFGRRERRPASAPPAVLPLYATGLGVIGCWHGASGGEQRELHSRH